MRDSRSFASQTTFGSKGSVAAGGELRRLAPHADEVDHAVADDRRVEVEHLVRARQVRRQHLAVADADEVAVERDHDAVVAELRRHERPVARRQALSLPELLAGLDVEGDHVLEVGDHAVAHQRR